MSKKKAKWELVQIEIPIELALGYQLFPMWEYNFKVSSYLNEGQIIILGGMSEEIWKWDTNRNVITEVMKADSIINKSVRMITFGKQATIKPLRLLEEDFFHNQPILFKDCLMLLGEENVHVVNFNKNMTFLRSWNDED